VLCVRVARNPIGWLFLAVGLTLGVGALCDAYSAPAVGLPGASVAAVGANIVGTLPIVLTPALLLLFPDGRLPSRRWRRAAIGWAVVSVVFLLAALGWPGTMGLSSDPSLVNPIGIGGGAGHVISAVGFACLLALFASIVVAAVSLVLRFRRATGDLRQQLKWFGTSAMFLALVAATSQFLPSWASGDPGAPISVALTALVVSTGIAILRHRLYEIDVIIRRTLVYAILVGVLAVMYLGGIYLLGRALQAATGQSDALAVTLSTLAVAAAFQPLQRRIQRSVDHRFYRGKYDAAQTLEAFAARLRDQIELDALSADVLTVVAATVRPSHASLWLRPAALPGAPDLLALHRET
jgi:hypothetical protein